MVLSGEWAGSGPKGEDGITRMTYSRQAGGGVRQRGEFSADGGKTWVALSICSTRPPSPRERLDRNTDARGRTCDAASARAHRS